MVDLVATKREQILRLAQRHGVTRVRVFGSMARGDDPGGISQRLSEGIRTSQPEV